MVLLQASENHETLLFSATPDWAAAEKENEIVPTQGADSAFGINPLIDQLGCDSGSLLFVATQTALSRFDLTVLLI